MVRLSVLHMAGVFCAVFCMVLALCGCRQELPQNILRNGSFEQGLEGWTLQRGVSPKFARFHPDDSVGVTSRPITFRLRPRFYDRPITFGYRLDQMDGNLAKLTCRFKIQTKDDRDVMVSYVLYGAGDYWANENTYAHDHLFITHVTNGTLHEDRELRVESLTQVIETFLVEHPEIDFTFTGIKSATCSIEIWSERGEEPLRAVLTGLKRYMGPVWREVASKVMDTSIITLDAMASPEDPLIKRFIFKPSDGERCYNAHILTARCFQKVQTTPGQRYLLVFDTKNLLGTTGPYIEVRGEDERRIAHRKVSLAIAQNDWVRSGLVFTSPGGTVSVGMPNTRAFKHQYVYANFFDNMALYPVTDDTLSLLLEREGLQMQEDGVVTERPLLMDEVYTAEEMRTMQEEAAALGIPVYAITVDLPELWRPENILEWRGDAPYKMLPGYRNMQPAKLSVDGSAPVDIRMKTRGFGVGHHFARTKSWRINFAKRHRVDLIRPVCRSFIGEAWAQRIAESMGLTPLQNDFVYLIINGRPQGLMWRIDRSSKSLELAGKPDGSVSDLTASLSKDPKAELTYVGEPFPLEEVVSVDIKPSKSFRKRYPTEHIVGAFSQMLEADDYGAFSQYFEPDNIIDLDVLSNILSSCHIDWMHNDVLFWNTACGRFEMLPYDVRIQNIAHSRMFIRHNPFMDFVCLRPENYAVKMRRIWERVSSEAFVQRSLATLDTLYQQTERAHKASVTYGYHGRMFQKQGKLASTYATQRNRFADRVQCLRRFTQRTDVYRATWQRLSGGPPWRYLLVVEPRGELELPEFSRVNLYYQDALLLAEDAAMSPARVDEIALAVDVPFTVRDAATGAALTGANGQDARPDTLLLPDFYRQFASVVMWRFQYEAMLRAVTAPQDADFVADCYTRKKFPYYPRPVTFLYVLKDGVRKDARRYRRLMRVLERYGVLAPRRRAFVIEADSPVRRADVRLALRSSTTGEAVPCAVTSAKRRERVRDFAVVVNAQAEAQRIQRARERYRMPFAHYRDIFRTAESFVARHAQFMAGVDGAVVLPEGQHTLEGTIVVPQGVTLRIAPGADVRMTPKSSLVCYGPVQALGTPEKPIVVDRAFMGRPWGSFAVLRTSRADFAHCVFRGGTEAYANGAYFSGMVAVHYADASFRHCTFESASEGGGDDSLNVKYGHAVIEHCSFAENGADAVDLDLVTRDSRIEDCRFTANANDGVDISGSRVDVVRCTFTDHGDKSVSAGERSTLRVVDCVMQRSVQGVTAKDLSRVFVRGTRIEQCKTGVTAYQKKAIFGGGTVVLKECALSGNTMDIGVQDYEQDRALPSAVYAVGTDFRTWGKSISQVVRMPKKQLSKKKFILAHAEGTLGEFGYRFATLTDAKNVFVADSVGDVPHIGDLTVSAAGEGAP